MLIVYESIIFKFILGFYRVKRSRDATNIKQIQIPTLP
jgi:hypothetical protein